MCPETEGRTGEANQDPSPDNYRYEQAKQLVYLTLFSMILLGNQHRMYVFNF